MEARIVALRGLVVTGGDAPPDLQLVDHALDGVAALVQVRVMGDAPIAPAALLLPVRGLVPLLRDDGLDTVSAQVGAVGARGVRLLSGYSGRPGARAAHGQPDTDLLQDGDELRAVGGLSGTHNDRQRAAPAVGRDVSLAVQPAPGSAEQGLFQAGPASASEVSPFFLFGVAWLVLSPGPPLFAGPSPASRTASARGTMASGSICIPAAS